MNTLRERIEAGSVVPASEPAPMKVDLREERITIRFTTEEIRAIDAEAQALGIGRSTLIRMWVRQGLGLQHRPPTATTALR